MKQLIGSDLAGFVKERQAKQVRSLVQSKGATPKLAIVSSSDNPVIKTYINLKQRYGKDIGVSVDPYFVDQINLADTVLKLNSDPLVHGIIVQLPLHDISKTDEIINLVTPDKDVDGLARNTKFDPATAMAINWLLAGYNISLNDKKICIVGHGKLVGSPLFKMWQDSGFSLEIIDEETENKDQIISNADLIVTAVGKPGLISSNLIKKGAVVVDAGVASENGKLKGDVADDLYERDDIKITPRKGGVGPLTVSALFDNVIRATTKKVSDS